MLTERLAFAAAFQSASGGVCRILENPQAKGPGTFVSWPGGWLHVFRHGRLGRLRAAVNYLSVRSGNRMVDPSGPRGEITFHPSETTEIAARIWAELQSPASWSLTYHSTPMADALADGFTHYP